MTTEYRYEPSIHEVRPNRAQSFYREQWLGYVTPEYVKNLVAKTPAERTKWLNGNWTPPLFGDFP